MLEALERLREPPDLLVCDGQGIAHPRQFGIACHLGLLTDLPASGVAKTRLCGAHAEPPDQRGAWTPLWLRDKPIGAVLRTRPGVKPLYISSGHRISLLTAMDYVMRCCTRYRLPETTRHAHRLASRGEQPAVGRSGQQPGRRKRCAASWKNQAAQAIRCWKRTSSTVNRRSLPSSASLKLRALPGRENQAKP